MNAKSLAISNSTCYLTDRNCIVIVENMTNRDVTIYWLLDMRPETIASGNPAGYPFFCGKTTDPEARLHKLLTDAWRIATTRDERIHQCGIEHIRMHVVRVIPAGEPWREHLASSIAMLKHCWPLGNCNISATGAGGAARRETGSAKSPPHPTGQKAAQIKTNRLNRRFRNHRKEKRPAPGEPAPRGSFRNDGSGGKW